MSDENREKSQLGYNWLIQILQTASLRIFKADRNY